MKEVLEKASKAFIIRILGTLLGFLVSVQVARLLGADGSGIYFLALSVLTIAATLGRVGIDNTVVRFIASHASLNEWADVDYIYKIAIKVVTIVSVLLSLMLFFSAGWLANSVFGKPYMQMPLQIISGAVLPFSLAMIHAESLRGLRRIPSSQWIKTVLISFGSIILLYPLVHLWAVNGAVVAYVSAVLGASLVAYLLWRKAWMEIGRDITDTRNISSIKPLFRSSMPLFGVALASLVMQQAGTIFLGMWGSVEDVGVFNVANRVVSLLMFPLIAMISILAPKFAAIFRQGDMGELRRLACQSSRILALFALPVAVLVAVSAEWIFAIFGSEFKEGVLVLDVLLIGVMVNVATGAVAEILMMTGFEKNVRDIVVISAVITVILCITMVPSNGNIGAAIATACGMGIQNLLMVVVVKSKLGFWPLSLGIKKTKDDK